MRKITKRNEDFPKWYQDIIEVADLAEHGPVKGTMIIKPNGYAIWENIQRILAGMFKEVGVKNAYFPLFIPESFLHREAKHVEGFSPECAVVTHAGGVKLDEPLVVRPTSETIMYDAYAKWIRSYRDLPLLINQWCNVVRWEKRPRLFLSTTEFLWQKGHNAHATREEADEFARMILEIYRRFVEDYLAIPVLFGEKSLSERFAGAERTYSIEAMMQDGKALQAGTSHLLGDNFAKVFNVKFLDRDNVEKFVFQTSWGVSTRLIGAMVMCHSDDNGLVIPPKVASLSVVMVPIWRTVEERNQVFAKTDALALAIKQAGLTVEVDKREERPGFKFYTSEATGVPVRVEIGMRDVNNGTVTLVRRDTLAKLEVKENEAVPAIVRLLGEIQENLFQRALAFQAAHTVSVDTWEQFTEAIEKSNFVLAHWDGTDETEAAIKEKTKATIRCLTFDRKQEPGKCVYSGKPSQGRVVFAKAY